LLEGGSLNRKALGERIFRDEESYRRFNDLIFPWIKEHARRRILGLCQGIWVVDAALIHEYRIEELFDWVVTVVAPVEDCIKRFVKKTGYSEEIARMVISQQLPQEEKARRSHFVVENRGSLEDLKEKAREIWEKILEDSK
jgi:dephospho-CoA kinase